MECGLQGERSLTARGQFSIKVTPGEVCNHGPEGSNRQPGMAIF